MVRDLVWIAWNRLTGRGLDKPRQVTDDEPLETLIWAHICFDRDDLQLVDDAHQAADAALRVLPELVELHFLWPPETAGDIRADVLLRAPNRSDREAAEEAAMDLVLDALTPVQEMPGVMPIEGEYGDL